MKLNSIHRPHPAFGSIKPEMRLAEKVLKQFYKDLGPIQSASLLDNKITRHEGKPLFRHLVRSVRKIANRLDNEIHGFGFIRAISRRYESIDEVADVFTKLVKKTGENSLKKKINKADCPEMGLIMMKRLMDQGLNPRFFKMTPNNTGLGKYQPHYSVVIGLKPGAKIDKPSTWGSKAIIVDPLHKTVVKAHKGLRFLADTCSVGNRRVKFSLEEIDPLKELI